VQPFTVDPPTLSELLAVTSLYRQGFELREAEAEALRDAATDVRRSLLTLYEQTNQRTPTSTSENVINSATESLKVDLNQFFQTVELYRGGVFSLTTRGAIATLGIGSQLDDLDIEFTDDSRAAHAIAAGRDLFPGVEDLIETGAKRTFELAQRTLEALEAARNIRVEKPDDNEAALRHAFNSSCDTLRRELRDQLQSEVDQFFSGVSVTTSKLIVEAKTKQDTAETILQRARLKRYSSAFLFTAVVFICFSVLYHHFKEPAPESFGGEALMHVLCGFLVEAIVFLIVKYREDAPKLLREAQEQVHVKLKGDLKHSIDAQLSSLVLNSLNENNLANKIGRIYDLTLALAAEEWKMRATEIFSGLLKYFGIYDELRREYGVLVEDIRNSASEYFTDSARNLAVLNRVAAGIKEEAIEPSFGLLEATQEKLLEVKTQVGAVDFD